jgi:hypothetical protein
VYGIPVAYVRGKLTRQAIARAAIDPEAIMREKPSDLCQRDACRRL